MGASNHASLQYEYRPYDRPGLGQGWDCAKGEDKITPSILFKFCQFILSILMEPQPWLSLHQPLAASKQGDSRFGPPIDTGTGSGDFSVCSLYVWNCEFEGYFIRK